MFKNASSSLLKNTSINLFHQNNISSKNHYSIYQNLYKQSNALIQQNSQIFRNDSRSTSPMIQPSSLMGNSQFRTKKRKVRIVHPEKLSENIVQFKRRRPTRDKYRNIIVTQDCSIGFKGEILLMRVKHAWKYVKKRFAVWETEENKEEKKDVLQFAKDNAEEIKQKRKDLNLRTLLDRCVIVFNRRIAHVSGHFFWPITKMDICNKIWNVHKIPLKPEDLDCKEKYEKPGLYEIYTNFNGEKIMMRMYIRKGGNSNDGYLE